MSLTSGTCCARCGGHALRGSSCSVRRRGAELLSCKASVAADRSSSRSSCSWCCCVSATSCCTWLASTWPTDTPVAPSTTAYVACAAALADARSVPPWTLLSKGALQNERHLRKSATSRLHAYALAPQRDGSLFLGADDHTFLKPRWALGARSRGSTSAQVGHLHTAGQAGSLNQDMRSSWTCSW